RGGQAGRAGPYDDDAFDRWHLVSRRVGDLETRQFSDVFVDGFLEVFFLREADDRLDDLAALEDEDGRDPADLELERDVGVFVDVQLADRDLARVLAGERVNRRPEPFAGAAPLRPEIHQHRRTGLQHAVVKIGIRKRLHVVASHRVSSSWSPGPRAPSARILEHPIIYFDVLGRRTVP